MAGTKLVNADLEVEGSIKLTTTPNNTGSIVTKHTDGTLSIRTPAQIKSDIGANFTAGSGLTLSGTTFSLPVTVSGSGNYVSNVAQTTNGITVTKATLPTTDISGLVPYTGANQAINFNTQSFSIGGDFNKNFSNFERSQLSSSSTGATHFTRLTDVASWSNTNDTSTPRDCIVISIPIVTSTKWVAEVDIFSGTTSNNIFPSDRPLTIQLSAYNTNNSSRSVSVMGSVDAVGSVAFGRNLANDRTIIIIRPSNPSSSPHYSYGKVNISKFYHGVSYHSALAVKSNYSVTSMLEADLTDFTLSGEVMNADFARDGYLWNKSDFTQTNVDNWNTAYGWGNHALANYENKTKLTFIEANTFTGASTLAKVATTASGNYTPSAGDIIQLSLLVSNTASGATLNIDGSGAYPIMLGGIAASSVPFAGTKVMLFFDGSSYQLFGSQRGTDNNNTYSSSTLSTISNTSLSRTLLINTYNIDNYSAGKTMYTLPGTASHGTMIEIYANASGGLRITAPSGDNILMGPHDSGNAGWIEINQGTTIRLRAIVANTTWIVVDSTGIVANNNGDTFITGSYSTGTLAELNTGTDLEGKLQTAKILNDWLSQKLTDNLVGYIPYTGATANVDLGTRSITSTGGFIGNLAGTASSASKLQTARTINGTSFNGLANITTANWGTARTLSYTGDVTGSSSVNGSANVATALTIATSSVTHAKYQNIASKRILGRGATGTGNVQELTLGTGLTLSNAGVLSLSENYYQDLNSVLDYGYTAQDKKIILLDGTDQVTTIDGQEVKVDDSSISKMSQLRSNFLLFTDYVSGNNFHKLLYNTPTGRRNHTLQDKTGILAHLDDITAQLNPTPGTGISITGTYPNLTFTNTSPNVTQNLSSVLTAGNTANSSIVLSNSLYTSTFGTSSTSILNTGTGKGVVINAASSSIDFRHNATYSARISPVSTLTQNSTHQLQDKSGIIAHLSDVQGNYIDVIFDHNALIDMETNGFTVSQVSFGINPSTHFVRIVPHKCEGTFISPNENAYLRSVYLVKDNNKIAGWNWATPDKWNSRRVSNDFGTAQMSSENPSGYEATGDFKIICHSYSGGDASTSFKMRIYYEIVEL